MSDPENIFRHLQRFFWIPRYFSQLRDFWREVLNLDCLFYMEKFGVFSELEEIFLNLDGFFFPSIYVASIPLDFGDPGEICFPSGNSFVNPERFFVRWIQEKYSELHWIFLIQARFICYSWILLSDSELLSESEEIFRCVGSIRDSIEFCWNQKLVWF